METGIVLGIGIFGYYFGKTIVLKIVFMICLPLLLFGFWGAVDFRKSGKNAEIFRLIQELFICFLASAAFYFSGHPVLCWILLLISVLHHILVYALGDTLLKNK